MRMSVASLFLKINREQPCMYARPEPRSIRIVRKLESAN